MTSKDFADVTLVTEDKKHLRAHRYILSACSSVFKNILEIDLHNNNPLIYLSQRDRIFRYGVNTKFYLPWRSKVSGRKNGPISVGCKIT